ncbi:MAG TPA: GNAT family protein [Haloplasmataceae bacterium]
MSLKEIFNEIPTIETKRIILRKIQDQDAMALYKYYNNENVYKYLDWNGPKSIEDALRIIKIWNRGFEEGLIIRLAIAEKTTNQIIGTIFLCNFEGKRAEVGYELSEDYWNKGIMSEALKEVLNLGFNQLGLTRIQAFTCQENIPSRNLLKKFHFREEGYLRQYECHTVSGICKDMYIYALLKEDFIY